MKIYSIHVYFISVEFHINKCFLEKLKARQAEIYLAV